MGMAWTRPARAFTLVELLVVVLVVGLLMGLLIMGLSSATRFARRASAEQTAAQMKLAVDTFQGEAGFLPPLVYDGAYMSAGDASLQPVRRIGGSDRVISDGPIYDADTVYPSARAGALAVATFTPGESRDFFRRPFGERAGAVPGVDSDNAWRDPRYSKFTLAYYLSGVLPASIDGVDGAGFVEPLADGRFKGVVEGAPARTRYPAFYDSEKASARLAADYFDALEVREHDINGSTTPPTDLRYLSPIVDRGDRAWRYYRWEPEATVEKVADLNLPPVLLDADQWDLVGSDAEIDVTVTAAAPDGRPELKSARYAVVGAGPDGLFGTEAIEDLAEALNKAVPASGSPQEIELRARALRDNIVQVGR